MKLAADTGRGAVLGAFDVLSRVRRRTTSSAWHLGVIFTGRGARPQSRHGYTGLMSFAQLGFWCDRRLRIRAAVVTVRRQTSGGASSGELIKAGRCAGRRLPELRTNSHALRHRHVTFAMLVNPEAAAGKTGSTITPPAGTIGIHINLIDRRRPSATSFAPRRS